VKRSLICLVTITVVTGAILWGYFSLPKNPGTNSKANSGTPEPFLTKEIFGRYYRIVHDFGNPYIEDDDKEFTFNLTLKEDGTFVLEASYIEFWGISRSIIKGYYKIFTSEPPFDIIFYNATIRYQLTKDVWETREIVGSFEYIGKEGMARVCAGGEITENKLIITSIFEGSLYFGGRRTIWLKA
jgi:hypothetical protein